MRKGMAIHDPVVAPAKLQTVPEDSRMRSKMFSKGDLRVIKVQPIKEMSVNHKYCRIKAILWIKWSSNSLVTS